MIALGRLKLKNPFVLAPMASYSDVGLRQICAEYGCAYSFTELIPTPAFLRRNDLYLKNSDFVVPGGIQFITHDTEELRKCIEMVHGIPELRSVQSIDLNLGCPDRKMMANNMGAALLNQPKLIRELFSTMRKHSRLPISAKLRLAIDAKHKKSKPYLRIAKIAKEEELDFITIHGRSAAQMYTGEVDTQAIREVAEAVDIPLVGNGNVVDEESALAMLEYCDAVMIGRHACKEPYIFGKLDYFLEHKKKMVLDETKEKLHCLRRYLELAERHEVGFQHVKIHLQGFLKGTGHKDIVIKLTHTKDMGQIRQLLKPILA